MAVRNDYFASGTDFSNNEPLDITELNETLDELYDQALADTYRLLDSNTTSTGAGTSGYTTIVSYTVAAGAVIDFVEIKALLRVSGAQDNWDSTAECNLRVRIDTVEETAYEPYARIGESDTGNSIALDWVYYNHGMFIFVYQPTSLEKSNGFTIDIQGSGQSAAGRECRIRHIQSWLFGR